MPTMLGSSRGTVTVEILGIWENWTEGLTNLYQIVREIFSLEKEAMRFIKDLVDLFWII